MLLFFCFFMGFRLGFKRLSEPTWGNKVTRFGKGWFGRISRDREVDPSRKRKEEKRASECLLG
jgi:hypothetical protein